MSNYIKNINELLLFYGFTENEIKLMLNNEIKLFGINILFLFNKDKICEMLDLYIEIENIEIYNYIKNINKNNKYIILKYKKNINKIPIFNLYYNGKYFRMNSINPTSKLNNLIKKIIYIPKTEKMKFKYEKILLKNNYYICYISEII